MKKRLQNTATNEEDINDRDRFHVVNLVEFNFKRYYNFSKFFKRSRITISRSFKSLARRASDNRTVHGLIRGRISFFHEEREKERENGESGLEFLARIRYEIGRQGDTKLRFSGIL